MASSRMKAEVLHKSNAIFQFLKKYPIEGLDRRIFLKAVALWYNYSYSSLERHCYRREKENDTDLDPFWGFAKLWYFQHPKQAKKVMDENQLNLSYSDERELSLVDKEVTISKLNNYNNTP